MLRVNNPKYKSLVTATLALFVSVAVIPFFLTACGNRTDNKASKTKLASLEDTLAYTMGSMQKLSYDYFIVSNCSVDSAGKDACMKGIEDGYRDKTKTLSFYDGISIGIQIVKTFVKMDAACANVNFVHGLYSGAFEGTGSLGEKSFTGADSAAFSKGVENAHIITQYLSQNDYKKGEIKEFSEGFVKGGLSVGNPDQYAYCCGLIFGGSRLKKAFNGVNKQIYGSNASESVSSELFFAGFKERDDSTAVIPHDKAVVISEKADTEIKERLYSDNKTKGEKFLRENKTKDGVVTLPDGLQYKIIRKGNGKLPSKDSDVEVHYCGKTTDGKVFEDSRKAGKPVLMNLNNVIPGFKEILQIMPAGSLWEVYIPQQLAYGRMQTDSFKPFSALIFEIELINIK